MHLKTLNAAPFAPVSVADVYEHLRWDTELEGSPAVEVYPLEATVTRNILTATDYVEKRTRLSLVQRTLQFVLPRFPLLSDEYRRRANWWDVREHGGYWLELPSPPLISISTVQYYDAANVLQEVASSDYFVTDAIVPRLQFVDGFVAPTTYRRDDAVRVTYLAGYAPSASPPETQAEYAANIPSPLLDAVMLGVQLLTDRFEPAERAALERARDALLQPYVILSV